MTGGFVVALADGASATSVNLRWVGASTSSGAVTGLGTSTVTIAPSAVATLTLDIRIAVDAAGLSSAFLSLEFDRELRNELNILWFAELSWTGVMMSAMAPPRLEPFVPGLSTTQESTLSQIGKLYTFDATTISTASDCCPASTTIAFGRVVFVTNHSSNYSASPDVFSGLFNAGIDGIFDRAGNDISASTTWGVAYLNIPEPSALALLALGLAALVAAGRGGRSS